MFDIIFDLIGFPEGYSGLDPQLLLYVCGALAIILVCVFVDLLYRIFSHFWWK